MRLSTVVLTMLILVGARAGAEPDSLTVAREHFSRATTAYDLGRYEEAAREYEQAYVTRSDAALLFDAGQAFRLAGDSANALRSYLSYLRREPTTKNRGLVEAHIAAARKQLSEAKQRPILVLAPVEPAVTAVSAVEPRRSVAGADAVVQMTDDPEIPGERQRKPLYKKWWLWTTLGAVVAVGVGVGVGVAMTTPKNASSPSGAPTVSFP